MSKEKAQTTSNILMVRPAHFGYNHETAASNAFQSNTSELSSEAIGKLAVREFDGFVKKLRAAGVNVIVAEDSDFPVKPDSVFPNNWVTFHENGTVVTYPMLSSIRRMERRDDILQGVMGHFRVEKKIQLEEYETIGQMLEGTGSMVFDRPNGLVYACLSPRTSEDLLERFCKLMRYQPVTFHDVDGDGLEIYHTNVMMALGESFVVICFDSIPTEKEKALLHRRFVSTEKEIIEITLEQMMHFAGNMLQVRNEEGNTFLAMSQAAYQSLEPGQIERIEQHTNILSSPIPTIEQFGGGSVRCMMAEIFLPKK